MVNVSLNRLTGAEHPGFKKEKCLPNGKTDKLYNLPTQPDISEWTSFLAIDKVT